MEKLIKNKLGQWSLKKGALALPPEPEVNSIENEVGKTHTVEIHPAIDHLYNIKGMIQNDPRGKIKISDLKRNPMFNQMARAKRGSPNFIPRDGDGWITADAIDNHIAALPKQKVNISVLPYTWGSQQHRNYEDKGQFVLSMQLHPDTLENMDEPTRRAWEIVERRQHNFSNNNSLAASTGIRETPQFGWARIDPYRTIPEQRNPNARWESRARDIVVSNPNHWHVDEIQSDFQNKDKISEANIDSAPKALGLSGEYINGYGPTTGNKLSQWLSDHNNANHPAYDVIKKAKEVLDFNMKILYDSDEKSHPDTIESYEDLENAVKKYELFGYKNRTDSEVQNSTNNIHKILSHGHDDPQHAIHSAVNALARRLGISSISMDTPVGQATQSGLRAELSADRNQKDFADYLQRNPNIAKEVLNPQKKALLDGTHPAFSNPNFKTGIDKIGMDKLTDFLNLLGTGYDRIGWDSKNIFDGDTLGDNKVMEQKGITRPEKDAINDLILNIENALMGKWRKAPESEKEESILSNLKRPVHQILTYDKRPKRLGMKRVPKASVLGGYQPDREKEVQHMPLYKAKLLKYMLLAKAKDIKSESLRREIEQLDLESLAELID